MNVATNFTLIHRNLYSFIVVAFTVVFVACADIYYVPIIVASVLGVVSIFAYLSSMNVSPNFSGGTQSEIRLSSGTVSSQARY